MKVWGTIALAASLCGCAAGTMGNAHKLQTRYDPSSVAWSKQPGQAWVLGQAFIQTKGGQPRTCAGSEVWLIPRSAYADERMQILYGNLNKGYNAAFMGVGGNFEPDDPRYHADVISAVCDVQGNFEFTGIAPGDYYLLAPIVWTVGNSIVPEGGAIMRRVAVTDGGVHKVILVP